MRAAHARDRLVLRAASSSSATVPRRVAGEPGRVGRGAAAAGPRASSPTASRRRARTPRRRPRTRCARAPASPACSSAADAAVVRADARRGQVPGAPVDVAVGQRGRQRARAPRAAPAPARRRRRPSARAGGVNSTAAAGERDEAGLLGRREVGDVEPERRRPRARAPRRRPRRSPRRATSSAPASARAAARSGARTPRRCSSRSAPARAGRRGREPRAARRRARAARAGCRRWPGSRRSTRRRRAAPARARQRRRRRRGRARRARSIGRSAPSSSDGSPSRDGEHERDRVGDQPARGEQQRLRARAVEPVRVVDEQRERARPRRYADSRLSVAAPIAKRSPRAAPGRAPARRASAAACGAGMRSSAAERRAQQLGQARERDLAPRTRSRVRAAPACPPRLRAAYSSSAVLPIPGSPTSASTPLRPSRALGQQPVERQPLVVAAEQHRADLTVGPGAAP